VQDGGLRRSDEFDAMRRGCCTLLLHGRPPVANLLGECPGKLAASYKVELNIEARPRVRDNP
jgi:hypothetical protein